MNTPQPNIQAYSRMADTVPVKKTCMTSFMALFQKSKKLVVDEKDKAIQAVVDKMATTAPAQASCYGNVSDATAPSASDVVVAVVSDLDPAANRDVVDALVKDVSEIAVSAAVGVVASQKKKLTYRSCLYCSSHPRSLPSEQPSTQAAQTLDLKVRIPESAP